MRQVVGLSQKGQSILRQVGKIQVEEDIKRGHKLALKKVSENLIKIE